PCERAGLVGVVGELQLMAFDQIHEVPYEASELGIPLHEFPGPMHNRPAQIRFPVSLVAGGSEAGLGTDGARLRFLGEESLGLVVVDDGYGVAALPLRGAIDTRRKIGSVLRLVGGFGPLRLTREIAGEAILAAG